GTDRRRGKGGYALGERHHAFVDVVHALTVERASRPRAPQVPPRLYLAPEPEHQRAGQQDLVRVVRLRERGVDVGAQELELRAHAGLRIGEVVTVRTGVAPPD